MIHPADQTEKFITAPGKDSVDLILQRKYGSPQNPTFRNLMSNMSANIKINPTGIAIVFVGAVFVVFVYWFGMPFTNSSNSSPTGPQTMISDSADPVDMKELLSASIHAARLGGEQVRVIREKAKLNEEVKGKTKEGAAELKTDGDMASHKIMFHGLKQAFPDINVVSEEHEKTNVDSTVTKLNKYLKDVSAINGEKISTKDITVWIDPLDATQEYTEDLRQYVTTMVCVAVKGKPVIGVIHRVFEEKTEDQTVWAYVNHGNSKNLQLIKTVEHAEGDGYSIIVSRSHSGDVESVAKNSFGQNTKIIPAGGAGYKTLEVIEGRADAYVHVTAIKKWDICAGNAILTAVNGKLTTLYDKEIDYSAEGTPVNSDGLLATTNSHQKYLVALAPIFKDEQKTRSKRSIVENKKTNYRVAKRESKS